MIEGICLGNVSIDCKDAKKLQHFYADLLGWETKELYDCPAVVSPAGLVFLFDQANDYTYVSPVWPESLGNSKSKCILIFRWIICPRRSYRPRPWGLKKLLISTAKITLSPFLTQKVILSVSAQNDKTVETPLLQQKSRC